MPTDFRVDVHIDRFGKAMGIVLKEDFHELRVVCVVAQVNLFADEPLLSDFTKLTLAISAEADPSAD